MWDEAPQLELALSVRVREQDIPTVPMDGKEPFEWKLSDAIVDQRWSLSEPMSVPQLVPPSMSASLPEPDLPAALGLELVFA